MNEVQRKLLLIMGKELFNQPCDCAVDDEVIKEAYYQAVPYFVQADYRSLFKNVKNNYAHKSLHMLLESNSIPYTILKGCAIASYYPDPLKRSLVDVDFLVNEKNLLQTHNVLVENGFSCINNQNSNLGGHHWGYTKDNLIYELHWKINGLPNGSSVGSFLENTIETSMLKDGMMVPDDFHESLILLLHSARHLTTSGLGLRHLCDWAVFVNSVDVSQWELEYRQCGLWIFAQYLTACCYRLGLPELPWVDFPSNPDIIDSLLDEIIIPGNFGRLKDSTNNLIDDINNDEKMSSNNSLVPLINRINRNAKELYPQIPTAIGIILILLRIASNIVRGRTQIPSFKEARKRRNLYKQLQLFD